MRPIMYRTMDCLITSVMVPKFRALVLKCLFMWGQEELSTTMSHSISVICRP